MMNYNVEDGRVYFSFTKCDGMSIHYTNVDEEWFNQHNTDDITAEELSELAFKDRDNSKAKGKISWWGLG